MLLLARGACIETGAGASAEGRASGCSSQEEHVLKQNLHAAARWSDRLLLARGACIETTSIRVYSRTVSPLLLARGACIETASTVKSAAAETLLLARGACIETAP